MCNFGAFLISHAGALEETKKGDVIRRLFSACLLFTVQDTLDLANSNGGLSVTKSLLSVSVKSTQYFVRELCTLADQALGASFF